ncbi:MAG: integral rane sensor signal transduction histidine kinase, partial [Solirubrobacterales bacterium]|nr:integral rane sensor signal transduction histidine kinase [Solirubrobacterales bacterium]
MSFRTRLLLTALTTLAVGLGALVVLGNVLLSHRVQTEASNLLDARMEAQIAALDVRGGAVAVREVVNDDRLDERAWVIDAGVVLERPRDGDPALDRAVIALARAREPVEREVGDDVRVLVELIGRRGAVAVALSVEPLERLQKEVLLGSLVVAGLVLLAGAFAIRSAVGGALQPVAEMTSAASSWSAGDLDRRFGLGPAKDELTGLAATLDALLGRIAASRRHEQRFASEVAHELRTPVAGLRARAELALQRDDPVEREAALQAVVAQAGRLD